jgi:O-antigen ligase
MALVSLAIALGGGGTVNPQTEMVLQVATFLLTIPLLTIDSCKRGLANVPSAAWLLAWLVIVIPVIQLIPLPPSIWQKLPGREVEVQSLTLALSQQSWMPLTVAPARTFASLLAMISAVLVFLQVARLGERGRNWICAAVAMMGGASLLLGVLQLSHTGGLDWSLYSEFHYGYLVGFQANRNAETDVLQIALLAVGVLTAARLADGKHHAATWLGLAIAALAFLVGIFLAGSRAGIAIAPLTLFVLAVMLFPFVKPSPKAAWWAAGAVLALVVFGAATWQLPAVQKVADRFAIMRESRLDLWADTTRSIAEVWPVGSGVGTIVPMLETAERLARVDPSRPVRAHNDWLEWTLEGGLAGILVLFAIAFVLALALFTAIAALQKRDAKLRRAQVIFAVGVFALEALHAIVDYPMRSMSLAALTGIAAAFLMPIGAMQREMT